MAQVFYRYFACTDSSPTGIVAARYCDGLTRVGRVQLVPTRPVELTSSHWARHGALLLTGPSGDCVNVVCGTIIDWVRFHTPGIRNALFVAGSNMEPENSQEDIMAAIGRYDVVYAHSAELAELVARVTGIRCETRHWMRF